MYIFEYGSVKLKLDSGIQNYNNWEINLNPNSPMSVFT